MNQFITDNKPEIIGTAICSVGAALIVNSILVGLFVGVMSVFVVSAVDYKRNIDKSGW